MTRLFLFASLVSVVASYDRGDGDDDYHAVTRTQLSASMKGDSSDEKSWDGDRHHHHHGHRHEGTSSKGSQLEEISHFQSSVGPSVLDLEIQKEKRLQEQTARKLRVNNIIETRRQEVVKLGKPQIPADVLKAHPNYASVPLPKMPEIDADTLKPIQSDDAATHLHQSIVDMENQRQEQLKEKTDPSSGFHHDRWISSIPHTGVPAHHHLLRRSASQAATSSSAVQLEASATASQDELKPKVNVTVSKHHLHFANSPAQFIAKEPTSTRVLDNNPQIVVPTVEAKPLAKKELPTKKASKFAPHKASTNTLLEVESDKGSKADEEIGLLKQQLALMKEEMEFLKLSRHTTSGSHSLFQQSTPSSPTDTPAEASEVLQPTVAEKAINAASPSVAEGSLDSQHHVIEPSKRERHRWAYGQTLPNGEGAAGGSLKHILMPNVQPTVVVEATSVLKVTKLIAQVDPATADVTTPVTEGVPSESQPSVAEQPIVNDVSASVTSPVVADVVPQSAGLVSNQPEVVGTETSTPAVDVNPDTTLNTTPTADVTEIIAATPSDTVTATAVAATEGSTVQEASVAVQPQEQTLLEVEEGIGNPSNPVLAVKTIHADPHRSLADPATWSEGREFSMDKAKWRSDPATKLQTKEYSLGEGSAHKYHHHLGDPVDISKGQFTLPPNSLVTKVIGEAHTGRPRNMDEVAIRPIYEYSEDPQQLLSLEEGSQLSETVSMDDWINRLDPTAALSVLQSMIKRKATDQATATTVGVLDQSKTLESSKTVGTISLITIDEGLSTDSRNPPSSSPQVGPGRHMKKPAAADGPQHRWKAAA